MGYALLLDSLDAPDAAYGTKMARLLANAQKRGILTSLDLVTDVEDKFIAIVPPALKYTDFCIINEIEAERTTGIRLREGEQLSLNSIEKALHKLHQMGVSRWAVIHAPEGGFGLDCRLNQVVMRESLLLPADYIVGTTGAGDAFCSGILYAAFLDKSLGEAIEIACACAACSLSEAGATEGMRPYADVVQLYQRYQRR